MSNEVLEQNVQTETKTKKRRGTWLLILLIIFVILFLLTTAILGSRLYEMATRDKYTVDLGVGEMDGSIELFRMEYENASGEITVRGVNADDVVAVIPVVGHVILVLKSPVAIIAMLAAAVLLVEWSFQTGKDEQEAEKEKIKAEIRALMEELKEE